ncbi:MAG: hypothetical protein LBI19_02550 [Oscillospiraceae bacterium]|nr:hypothetical protein [Oscillospiraceae bacterium]
MTRTYFKNASKRVKILAIVPAIIIVVAVVIMLILAMRGPSVTIENRQIRISGLYGQTIDFDEVKSVALLEKSMGEMDSGTRINGVGGFGQTLLGYFNSRSLGETVLFVQAKTSPTIWIECEGRRDVYISYGDSQKTRDLYETLRTIN